MMSAIGGFLAEGGIFTVIGFCAIGAGLCLLGMWWLTRPEDGRTGVHRDPVRTESGEFPVFVPANRTSPEARHASPLLARDNGHVAKRRFEGTEDEGTRRLWPTTNVARSRVVTIGPNGIEEGRSAEVEEGQAARRAHHAGESPRVRIDAGQGDEQEEGGADRERREDEGRPVAHGKEGGADAQTAREVAQARWFHNAVTGEYIFLDEQGRRVDWAS